jgi:N-acetyl-anhydromuramyl-L-alanine amidase AmpD
MSDYPDAVEYLVDESRVFIDQNSHSAVVIHGTGGNAAQTAQQLGDFFRADPNMASSHYGIDRAGVICQFVLEKDGAAANCCIKAGHDPFWDQFNGDNLNIHTISIEHENDITNSLPLTQAQQEASFKLVAHLCQKYTIPMSHIKSHASIDPINRSHCPGVYPWDELWAFLQGGNTVLDLTDPVVKQFFTDGGNGTWKCRNGVVLLGSNLDFYRSNGGPALFGLPLSQEVYLPQYPHTAIVPCERALIVYDPNRSIDNPPIKGPCYLLHINSGPGQQLLKQNVSATAADLTHKLT